MRHKLELARMIKDFPVCVMANPAIVSHSKLPYIDFVEIGLREN